MEKKINLSGFPTILFVVFFILKLTGVIDWSWWWVTAPLWISAGLGVLGLLLLVVGIALKSTWWSEK